MTADRTPDDAGETREVVEVTITIEKLLALPDLPSVADYGTTFRELYARDLAEYQRPAPE